MRWVPYVLKSRRKTLSRGNEFAVQRGQVEFPEVVDLALLRSALLTQPVQAGSAGEARLRDKELVAASVLFPIVLREHGPTVLLTQRNDHLRDHPGQISFPGGRVEQSDLSPAHTALREAEEEIGLSPSRVEIIGFLPEYCTVTGYRITPVVGLLTPPFQLRPAPSEVAEVFEVPLSFLLNPANHERHSREDSTGTRHFFAVSYGSHFIWGATAGIIVTLARALAI